MPSYPFLLDDPFLSTSEAAIVSGMPLPLLREWIRPDRSVVVPGHRPGRARHFFTLLDTVKVGGMYEFTTRVSLAPSVAERVAQTIASEVLKRSPRDDQGRPAADPTVFSATEAMVLFMEDGAARGGLIDIAAKSYAGFTGQMRRPHVVVPVAPLLEAVFSRFMELRTGVAPETVRS